MVEQEISEGNKLIAEFMELKPTEWGGMYSISQDHCTCRENTPEMALSGFASIAKYHDSWDWLMPVLRKILDITFLDEDKETSDSSYFYDIRDCLPDIDSTYRAIVDFIKLYNTKKDA